LEYLLFTGIGIALTYMNISQQLKNSLREFGKKFEMKNFALYSKKHDIPATITEIKHFLTTHTIKLLQAEIERLEGEKQKTYETIGCTGTSADGWCCPKHRDFTKVFDDQISHLQEEIKGINI